MLGWKKKNYLDVKKHRQEKEDHERKFKGTYDKRKSEIKWKYINRTARDGESF